MLKESEEYKENIKSFLIDQWKEIKPEWLPLIEACGQCYDNFLLAKDSVNSLGLVIQTSKGYIPNPGLKVQNDSLQQLRQLVDQLGISPKNLIRLKLDSKDGEEDEFLKTLRMND